MGRELNDGNIKSELTELNFCTGDVGYSGWCLGLDSMWSDSTSDELCRAWKIEMCTNHSLCVTQTEKRKDRRRLQAWKLLCMKRQCSGYVCTKTLPCLANTVLLQMSSYPVFCNEPLEERYAEHTTLVACNRPSQQSESHP